MGLDVQRLFSIAIGMLFFLKRARPGARRSRGVRETLIGDGLAAGSRELFIGLLGLFVASRQVFERGGSTSSQFLGAGRFGWIPILAHGGLEQRSRSHVFVHGDNRG